ncbi:MAG: pentapeptide repeat-containing protein [Dehalococcoidia bacterium]|nr:MAG: pentapeptide repeat-containing protein [Dehalococcoidia bacterium]
MLIEIKNRVDSKVILSGEYESVKDCLVTNKKANLSDADLSGANLSDADLSGADLSGANLSGANLSGATLSGADLCGADLSGAYLSGANLIGANLREANLSGANLSDADLSGANLSDADLSGADLSGAYLSDADLSDANLCGADLIRANLRGANLIRANLRGAKGLIKIMGVEPGNFYWKRFELGLKNNGFQFKVGLNELKKREIFAEDERILCSNPGFHFASRTWCAVNYSERRIEAKIQIPLDAKINEPWATDGKASADKIIILQVFDVDTGEDITGKFSV